MVQIIHPTSSMSRVDNYKLIWCPFIPTKDDGNSEDDDPFKLLALLNGKKGECFILCKRRFFSIVFYVFGC